DAAGARHEYGIETKAWDALPVGDAVVLAVAHDEFISMGLPKLLGKLVPGGCVVDVKSALDRARIQEMGFTVWRL
ncbi:MAG TPA: nucleotide sugar dehydrogenase, partial [Usitatibacter sp.]